jgi:hypothetical protein
VLCRSEGDALPRGASRLVEVKVEARHPYETTRIVAHLIYNMPVVCPSEEWACFRARGFEHVANRMEDTVRLSQDVCQDGLCLVVLSVIHGCFERRGMCEVCDGARSLASAEEVVQYNASQRCFVEVATSQKLTGITQPLRECFFDGYDGRRCFASARTVTDEAGITGFERGVFLFIL